MSICNEFPENNPNGLMHCHLIRNTKMGIHFYVFQIFFSGAADTFSFLAQPLPCDYHIVALRTLSQPTNYSRQNGNVTRSTKPQHAASLILHRFGIEYDSLDLNTRCSTINDEVNPVDPKKWGENSAF